MTATRKEILLRFRPLLYLNKNLREMKSDLLNNS